MKLPSFDNISWIKLIHGWMDLSSVNYTSLHCLITVRNTIWILFFHRHSKHNFRRFRICAKFWLPLSFCLAYFCVFFFLFFSFEWKKFHTLFHNLFTNKEHKLVICERTNRKSFYFSAHSLSLSLSMNIEKHKWKWYSKCQ